jgi:histidine kinase
MVLFSNYQAAVTEALSLATVAALIAAVLASFLISRQVVRPVQRMMVISHRIAEGEYEERLRLSGNVQSNQLDELDQLAITFNQMADKLEKTETMRRQLVGDVTHELRTPLAAIKGYMEGLMDGVLPATPETYQQVHAEADRLQRLVNDLQELSRVEAGAFQLKLESVSPANLIETVVSHLNRQFEDKGIYLEEKLDAGLPNVSVDKDRILQVLTNLVGNALQYTPSGGKVVVSASQAKFEIVISVTDTGIGISPDHLPFIFNRFYRIDKSRARASGGSGIGLTIAQALVKAHHGRIWAESAGEGKGSSFHFTLPVVAKLGF